MSKQVTYRCNLCRTEDTTGERTNGIHFTSGAIELRHPTQTENHLCHECMRMLRDVIQTEGTE